VSLLEVTCCHRYPSGFRLHASFTADGGVTAVVGPSGSGKTTLLSILAGLLRPREGRIVLAGEVLLDSARGIHVPPERRHIGYVFQDYLLFPHLSVRQNLLYGWKRRPADSDAPTPEDVIAVLELGELLERSQATLSGGQRQRVALGRALLYGPRLLLLDEPVASLDEPLKKRVLGYLERALEKWSIPTLYVTHRPEEVRPLAARVVELKAGEVVRVEGVKEE
jgi:molybdate transport system ATP-binding protein